MSDSDSSAPQKTNEKLTEGEVLVLKSHLEEWKEAAGKDRKDILNTIIQEANGHAPKMNARLLANRTSMYKIWLYNHRSGKPVKKANKFGKKWTARLVIEHQHKKEILEKTGAKPGDKEMIKKYQGAVNSFMQSLSNEQMEEARKTAQEWSTQAPPADVQANFAEKKAPGLMKDLATELWRQAGMRILVLSAWKTQDGEIRLNAIDFNEKLEGKSFTDTKDWKPLLSEWNAYAGEEFGADPEQDHDSDDEEVKGRKIRRKKDGYPLELDSDGLPVIPTINGLNLESKKSLIRTFITSHYRFCCQKPKASVPWSAVRDEQSDFIEPIFLPAGQTLKDPSKLQMAEADQLLQFWYERQKNKVEPIFQFKAWQNQDREMEDPVDADADSDTGRAGSKKRSAGKVAGKKVAMVEEPSSDEHQEGEEGDEYDYDYDDDDEDLPFPPRPHYSRKRGSGIEQVEQSPEPEHPDPPPAKKSKPAPTKKGRVEAVQPEPEPQQPYCPPLAKKSKPAATKRGRVEPVEPESEPDEEGTPPAKKSKPAATKRGMVEPVEPESDPDQEGTPPAKKPKQATSKRRPVESVEPESAPEEHDSPPAKRGPRVRKLTQKMAEIVAQGSQGKVTGARTKATGGKTK